MKRNETDTSVNLYLTFDSTPPPPQVITIDYEMLYKTTIRHFRCYQVSSSSCTHNDMHVIN